MSPSVDKERGCAGYAAEAGGVDVFGDSGSMGVLAQVVAELLGVEAEAFRGSFEERRDRVGGIPVDVVGVGVGGGAEPTGRHAENSEVLPCGSVAVQLTIP